jgi:hypothetical protein
MTTVMESQRGHSSDTCDCVTKEEILGDNCDGITKGGILVTPVMESQKGGFW